MKILMVCLGNICRSPMAHGIMEDRIRKYQLPWEVDSAGTSGWHNGENPDSRAVSFCLSKNVDISHYISRKFVPEDLENFDIILAMDSSNYQDIIKHCRDESQAKKVQLIMNYTFPGKNIAVPDPYYDGSFSRVYHLLTDAIDAFVNEYKPARKKGIK
jgi:protein-tyrosine phosphatase